MSLLLHAYDPVGTASLFANAAAQGAARQQQQLQFLAQLSRDIQHDRALSVENQRRLDFEKSKEAEHVREFDADRKPYVPPSLPGGTPAPGAAPTDAAAPGLDTSDTITPDETTPGVNLYNMSGNQPLTAPLIPPSDTSAFMSVPTKDAAPDVPDVPVELAPSQVKLQPPDLSAVSAEQSGGLAPSFGPVDPFEPPQFNVPQAPAPAVAAPAPEGGPGELMGGEAVPNQSLAQARATQFAQNRKQPFTPPALPEKVVDKVKRETVDFAQTLAGMPEKFAVPAITNFATHRAAAAASENDNTLPDGSRLKNGKQYRADENGQWNAVGTGQAAIDDLTKNMTFDQATNTYANADGAKFFVGTGTGGKMKLSPWKPETVKAKRTFLGSDGRPYSIGTDGNPLQPIPEGVQLMEGKLPPARTLPDGSLGIVNPDRTVTTLIPATIKLGDKAKSEYLKALNDAHVALADLNATELQYQAKPGVAKDWYGITDKTVKEKKESFEAAQQKVLDMQTLYPALKIANPTVTPPAAAPAAPAAAPVAKPAADAAPASIDDPEAFKAAFSAAKSGDTLYFKGKPYRKP